VHHEEILAATQAEFLGSFLIHDIRSPSSGQGNDCPRHPGHRSGLGEEKKSFGMTAKISLRRFFLIEEVAVLKTVSRFVLRLNAEMLDERRDALAADVDDDAKGEISSDVGFGRHRNRRAL